MTLSFQVSGISGAEHIEGAKGEEVDQVAMPQISIRLQPGEVGCWRSHVNAWKRLVEAGWQTALVIEGASSLELEYLRILIAVDDVDWHMDLRAQLNSMSRIEKVEKINWRCKSSPSLRDKMGLIHVGSLSRRTLQQK